MQLLVQVEPTSTFTTVDRRPTITKKMRLLDARGVIVMWMHRDLPFPFVTIRRSANLNVSNLATINRATMRNKNGVTESTASDRFG
jgi:hypothetical protein